MQNIRNCLVGFGLVVSVCGCGGGGHGSQTATEQQGASITSDTPAEETTIAPEEETTDAPEEEAFVITDDRFWTYEGVFEGTIVDGIRVFYGIPYAQPPVGKLRFAAPKYPEPFDGVYDATMQKSPCARPAAGGVIGAEDCLYLDIWVPAEKPHNSGEPPPIIVFLQGRQASSKPELINAARLATETEAIVITVDYRLDVLGFLATDELMATSLDHTGGNYGVRDVIAALGWINSNARSLSGDVNRVLLTGDSDSARLLCHLLAIPETNHLYQALALLSPACGNPLYSSNVEGEATPYPAAVTFGGAFTAAAGCDDPSVDAVDCLRELPLSVTLESAQSVPRIGFGESPFRPIIDGALVTADPHQALRAEAWPGKPLIVGSGRMDMSNMLDDILVPDDATYRTLLAQAFAAPVDEQLYSLFPTSSYPSPKAAYVDLFTHVTYGCQAEALAASAAVRGRAYLYDLALGFDAGDYAGMGAVNGAVIPYLFATFAAVGASPDEAAMKVSSALQSALWSMARKPNENPWISWIEQWAPYEPGSENALVLDDPVAMVDGHRSRVCQKVWPLIGF